MGDDRYSRFTVLHGIGESGLFQIQKAHVTIVGIGGLGCVSASQFAALGVGTLRIVDNDIIEQSNLQRQQLFTEKDLGLPKVEVAQQRLQELNPHVKIEPLAITVTEASANRVVQGTSVIVDGLDRFSPRYALNRAAISQKIPYVFAGALATTGNMTTIIPEQTPCLECVLGGMDDTQPTCATVGIYPTLLGVIGNLQVHEALRIILDKPPNLANQLLLFDIEKLSLDMLPITRNTNCSVCSVSEPRPQAPLEPSLIVTELCTEETFLLSANKPIPIDINKAALILQNKYPIIAQSVMGLQIQWTNKVEISIVGEGNILIKGVDSPETAETIYHQIMREIKDALRNLE